MLRVTDQAAVGARASLGLGTGHDDCGDVLPARLVTVPGGSGVPLEPWSGEAADADASNGTKNRKFGNRRRGIRRADARFPLRLEPKRQDSTNFTAKFPWNICGLAIYERCQKLRKFRDELTDLTVDLAAFSARIQQDFLLHPCRFSVG